jgi:hypothetical protein
MRGGPGVEPISGGKKQTGDGRTKIGEEKKVFGLQFWIFGKNFI